jgi:hypothetical protein
MCNADSAKPKGVRLGYMGHLTLISEDVIVALQQLPPDLRHIISQLAPQPDWDDYVNGRYNETKKRDTSLLGGGKPVVAPGGNRGAQRWRVDEEDNSASTSALITHPENGNGSTNGMHEPKGVFRKTPSSRPVQNVDFGPAPMEDDEGGGGRLKQVTAFCLGLPSRFSPYSPLSSFSILHRRCSHQITMAQTPLTRTTKTVDGSVNRLLTSAAILCHLAADRVIADPCIRTGSM